jgi:hypothetical protein
MSRYALPVALLLAVAFALLWGGRARAIDRVYAGSAQLDYHFVPTQPDANVNQGTDGKYGFDGFTIEAAGKLAIDVSDHFSANVKVCFGCHGFELDMAYLDYRVADELNFRAGRFSPAFGAFNLRHDVGNQKLSDKPLPYDMGRMLRMRAWGLSVLPSPFPDQGLEIDGTHWFGSTAQLDYAAYLVSGFRTNDQHPVDIDFKQSHLPYYVDNNGHPTGGARLAITYKLGEMSDATLGASGMYGTYDPNNQLSYAILGGDLTFRLERTNVRFEYLVRRTDFDTSNPGRFVYAVPASGGDFVVKHGWYGEIEQPMSKDLDLIGRLDGMYRVGNVLQDPTGDTPLRRRSTVFRYTLGTSYAIERGLRLKLSTELWQWTDKDDTGRDADVGVHVGMVGTF